MTTHHADHPYILAFSLIMLHTDAFNKSNRRKMSKADYLKNTTLPGLIPEVLDVCRNLFAPQWNIHDGPSVFLRQYRVCTVHLYRGPSGPRRKCRRKPYQTLHVVGVSKSNAAGWEHITEQTKDRSLLPHYKCGYFPPFLPICLKRFVRICSISSVLTSKAKSHLRTPFDGMALVLPGTMTRFS